MQQQEVHLVSTIDQCVISRRSISVEIDYTVHNASLQMKVQKQGIDITAIPKYFFGKWLSHGVKTPIKMKHVY